MSTQHLEHREALKKMKALVDDIKTCMLATNLGKLPLSVRPMQTLQIDDTGNLWFFNSRESLQYTDIKNDPRVQLIYSHPGKTEFVSIYGVATESQDMDKINELWNIAAKAWFSGKNDPNLMVLRVSPQDAYYWDTNSNKLVTLFSTLTAAFSDEHPEPGQKGNLEI